MLLKNFFIKNPVSENRYMLTGIIYCALVQLNDKKSEANECEKNNE